MRFSRAVRWTAWFLAGLLVAFACDNGSGPGLSLDVTPDSAHLFRTDTVRLAVFAVDGAGHLVSGVPFTFTSADTTIVTVTNLGLVRGENAGRTTVRVSGGGAQHDVPIAVHLRPALVIVGPTDTLIAVGATVQMHASVFDANNFPITDQTPTWESSAPTQVSVSSTGLARAEIPNGVAMITARVVGITGFARVYVRGPVSLRITPRDTTIRQGDSLRLRGTVYDQVDSIPGATVTWESTDTTLFTISTNGTVRTKNNKAGRGTIIAWSGSLSDITSLTVRDTAILGNRVPIEGWPYGAAISSTGVAYVTLGLGASKLARTDLPSQAFAKRVNVGTVPTEVTFNSSGARAYVTNQLSHNVGVIDVASDSQIDVIPVPGDPFEVIVAPGDSILYVATNVNRVFAIRLATKDTILSFATGGVGNGMLIRDTLLYVSTHVGGSVIEFNLNTRLVARTFSVGGVPQKMAISSDGNTLYIANEAGYLQFWDRIAGTQIGGNMLLPANGYGVALRPTTGKLYVTTAYFGSGLILLIDPATRAILASVETLGSTRDVTFHTDGTGFVPNENGWVDFIK
jgi:YVTN family beta-propeller protein